MKITVGVIVTIVGAFLNADGCDRPRHERAGPYV